MTTSSVVEAVDLAETIGNLPAAGAGGKDSPRDTAMMGLRETAGRITELIAEAAGGIDEPGALADLLADLSGLCKRHGLGLA